MIPFKRPLAVSHEVRNSFSGIALKKGFERLIPGLRSEGWISIVCPGPSLKDTWKDIERPVLTCSSAHDFMVSKGVIPDFHVECDPRPHKANTTKSPQAGCTYLMASCCHPDSWENLKDSKVLLWHMDNGPDTIEWVRKNDPGGMVVGSGSTVALRSFHVAGLLGYRKFNIYGMDGNYRDGEFRVIKTDAPPHVDVDYKIDGRVFKTTDMMVNAMLEFYSAAKIYGFEYRLHGDGMVKAYMDWHSKKEMRDRYKNALRPLALHW